jgi:hypothetical protein
VSRIVVSPLSPPRMWLLRAVRCSSTTPRPSSSSSPCRYISFRSVPSDARSCPSWASRGSASWPACQGPPSPTGSVPSADAWRLARGEGEGRVEPRKPPAELAETLEFPEPLANELTLGRALAVLVDRLLARDERGGRLPRRVAVSARLVGGGSWRRTATLREPTADPQRLRQALAPKLAELPAPAVELRLELGELSESVGTQSELVRPRGSRLRSRLREGLRQARASVGIGAVSTIVEVAPWSRIPETRAILVPRDD